ncbi:MAG TPA: phosphate uptake regulator PhoU [Thermoplasmatales archaeon]|nr:phosphate uptake regulator PhoU [Thermoplasmatales archaeon]
MEIRKIQLTGGASFIVSLPKEWAKSQGLKKNDSVGIVARNDGSLLLIPKISSEQTQREKEFDASSIEKSIYLFRMLVGAYIEGYNVIVVKSRKRMSPQLRETVRKFVRGMIGLEIIEEASNSITIKDLLNPAEMPFDKATKRISSIVSNMHKDALFALQNGDEALSKDIIARDDEVDRLHWLISRQYNAISKNILLAEPLGLSSGKIANYSLISRIVERIGDHAVAISKNNIHLAGEELEKAVIDLIVSAGNTSITIFTTSMEAFFDEDIEVANKNIECTASLVSKCEEIGNIALEHTGEKALYIGYIGESIRRVGEYSADLAEYVINYLVGKE